MLRRKRKKIPTNRNQHYQKQSQEKHLVSKISKGTTGVYKLHSSRHRAQGYVTDAAGIALKKVHCKWHPAFPKPIPPKQVVSDISKHNTGVYKLHSSRHRGHKVITQNSGNNCRNCTLQAQQESDPGKGKKTKKQNAYGRWQPALPKPMPAKQLASSISERASISSAL